MESAVTIDGRVISRRELQRRIKNEVVRARLDEGTFDDVKGGIKRLSAYVTKKFGAVAGKWVVKINDSIGNMTKIPDDITVVFGAIKQGMQETGESLKLDAGLQAAKELGRLTSDGARSIVQQDLEGPVRDRAASANEGLYTRSLYAVLSEHNLDRSVDGRLDESVTVGSVLGVGLAVMGGLPMIFKGLMKLAHVLHAERCEALFKKAHHVTHHFEEKTIDFVVPDKLSYFVYNVLWKRGMKLSKSHLEFIDFQLGKEHAMKKAQGLIYKALLIYFAWNGLKGVLEAGTSILGFVEGTATTVKGIELAKGATEIATLVRASSNAV